MITTGNWQDALEPIARKNFQLGFKEKPQENHQAINSNNSRPGSAVNGVFESFGQSDYAGVELVNRHR